MSAPWWSPDQNYESICCYRVSESELDHGLFIIGRCSGCHDMSEFELIDGEVTSSQNNRGMGLPGEDTSLSR